MLEFITNSVADCAVSMGMSQCAGTRDGETGCIHTWSVHVFSVRCAYTRVSATPYMLSSGGACVLQANSSPGETKVLCSDVASTWTFASWWSDSSDGAWKDGSLPSDAVFHFSQQRKVLYAGASSKFRDCFFSLPPDNMMCASAGSAPPVGQWCTAGQGIAGNEKGLGGEHAATTTTTNRAKSKKDLNWPFLEFGLRISAFPKGASDISDDANATWCCTEASSNVTKVCKVCMLCNAFVVVSVVDYFQGRHSTVSQSHTRRAV